MPSQGSPFLSTDPNAAQRTAPAAGSPFLSTDPLAVDGSDLPVFRSSTRDDANLMSAAGISPLAFAVTGADHLGDIPGRVRDVLNQMFVTPAKAYAKYGPATLYEGTQDIPHGIAEGDWNRVARGGSKIISGSMTTALPFSMAGMAREIVAEPVKWAANVLGGTLAGTAASAGTHAVAKTAGASDDVADFLAETAGIGGGVGAGMAVNRGAPDAKLWYQNRRAANFGAAYDQALTAWMKAGGARANKLHFKDLALARQAFEAAHQLIPIEGKEAPGATQALVEAGNHAVERFEHAARTIMDAYPDVEIAPGDNGIRARVARMPTGGQGTKPAEYMAAAEKVIKEWGLDQPKKLLQSDEARAGINATMRTMLGTTGEAQRDALMSNPRYVALQEAADYLREQQYGALEDKGVHGVADLRRMEGAVIRVRNVFDPLMGGTQGTRKIAGTAQGNFAQRLGQKYLTPLAATVGYAKGGPLGGLAATEIADATGSRFLGGKNRTVNDLLTDSFKHQYTSLKDNPLNYTAPPRTGPGGPGGPRGGGPAGPAVPRLPGAGLPAAPPSGGDPALPPGGPLSFVEGDIRPGPEPPGQATLPGGARPAGALPPATGYVITKDGAIVPAASYQEPPPPPYVDPSGGTKAAPPAPLGYRVEVPEKNKPQLVKTDEGGQVYDKRGRPLTTTEDRKAADAVKVTQYSGDPNATPAPLMDERVKFQLQHMLETLEALRPEKGGRITAKSGEEIYVPGAPGTRIADDFRLVTQQHLGNAEIEGAIHDLLDGTVTKNKDLLLKHAGVLDLAQKYMEKAPGFKGPELPWYHTSRSAIPGASRRLIEMGNLLPPGMGNEAVLEAWANAIRRGEGSMLYPEGPPPGSPLGKGRK